MITARDLKLSIHDKLRSSGIADKLKSELRAKLIKELDSYAYSNNKKPLFENMPLSPIQKVANTLISEYLKVSSYDFSLSIFLPESGLSYNNELSMSEVYKLLDINDTSKISPHSDNCLLLTFMKTLTHLANISSNDKNIQTISDEHELLDMKIRDSEQTLQSQNSSTFSLESIEKRIESYQKQINQKVESDMIDKLEQFKKVELNRLAFEEAQKYQFSIDKINSEHSLHLESLKKQYEYDLESQVFTFQQRIAILEKENNHQRTFNKQKSSEILIQQSNERAQLEIDYKRELEEKLKISEVLKCVENENRKLKLEHDHQYLRFQEEISRCKIQMHQELASQIASVEMEKAEKQGLDQVKGMNSDLSKKINSYAVELESLKSKLSEMNHSVTNLSKEKENLVHENKDLLLKLESQRVNSNVGFEIMTLKKQLIENERLAEERIKESQAKSNQDSTIHTELANIKKSEATWMKECHSLIKQLDIEINKREEVRKRYDDMRIRNKELISEVSDLKVLLHQTQSALNVKSSPAPVRISYSNQNKTPSPLNLLRANSTPQSIYENQSKRSHSKLPEPSLFAEYSNQPVSENYQKKHNVSSPKVPQVMIDDSHPKSIQKSRSVEFNNQIDVAFIDKESSQADPMYDISDISEYKQDDDSLLNQNPAIQKPDNNSFNDYPTSKSNPSSSHESNRNENQSSLSNSSESIKDDIIQPYSSFEISESNHEKESVQSDIIDFKYSNSIHQDVKVDPIVYHEETSKVEIVVDKSDSDSVPSMSDRDGW